MPSQYEMDSMNFSSEDILKRGEEREREQKKGAEGEKEWKIMKQY